MPTKDDQMITLREAATYAGKPYRTVAWAARKGYLPSKQFGKVRLTTRADVDYWLSTPQFHRVFGQP